MALRLEETVKVTATLVVVPEHGKPRDATPEDLAALGWVQRQDIHRRIIEFMGLLGLDPEGEHSMLRYLIENASGSNGIRIEECSDGEDGMVQIREYLRPLLAGETQGEVGSDE